TQADRRSAGGLELEFAEQLIVGEQSDGEALGVDAVEDAAEEVIGDHREGGVAAVRMQFEKIRAGGGVKHAGRQRAQEAAGGEVVVATEDAGAVGGVFGRQVEARAAGAELGEIDAAVVPGIVVDAFAERRRHAAHAVIEDRKVLLDIAALGAGAQAVLARLSFGLVTLLGELSQRAADFLVAAAQDEVANLQPILRAPPDYPIP